MAGRFPLYTDADVRGPLVQAMVRAGWDVVRAIDAFPQGTSDDVHFEHAAKPGTRGPVRHPLDGEVDVRALPEGSLRQ